MITPLEILVVILGGAFGGFLVTEVLHIFTRIKEKKLAEVKSEIHI